MGELFVTQGSIFNPGWQVVEQVGARHQRVLANFGDESWSEAEARAFLTELTAAS
jgi:hypothetical protein